jgi:hypothetical protein
MATVQRNVKTYGNRSFVGEVASAPSNYAPVLSNEVDADLDTIYSAWNGGADSVNIKDGSVSFAKLAPDAQLWRDTGVSITPGTNFAARPIVAVPGDASFATVLLGSATARGRVQAQNANVGIGLFANRNWQTNAQDDATKPSWGMYLSSVNDNCVFQRSPAGSTTNTALLVLDATGNLTAIGNTHTFSSAALNTCTLKLSGRGTVYSDVNVVDIDSNSTTSAAYDRNGTPSWKLRLESAGGINQILFQYRAPRPMRSGTSP